MHRKQRSCKTGNTACMEMKAGLAFACMKLKKLAKILAMGNRKLMSFMFKVEILLDEINAQKSGA